MLLTVERLKIAEEKLEDLLEQQEISDDPRSFDDPILVQREYLAGLLDGYDAHEHAMAVADRCEPWGE